MSTWSYPLEFPIGSTASCSSTSSFELKIQMQVQDLSGMYGTPPDTALTAPDWDNPVVLESPFNFSDLTLNGSPEAGAIGSDEVTLEADNLVIGELNGEPVRMYDVLLGRDTGTGLEFDADRTALHVRILYKAAGAASYSVRFWGIVDFSTLEAVLGDVSDPDTWQCKCRVIDSVYGLEHFNMVEFVEAALPMSAALSSTAKYLTFIGALNYGGSNIPGGRYAVHNIRYDDGGNIDWLGNREYPKVPDGNSATQSIRFHRIVDILQAAHDFLGLEASAVNDGAPWSDVCAWHWYYNDIAPTGAAPTLTEVTIDGLCIVSGFYIHDGTQYVYAHRNTFFDRDKAAPHSFMAKSNPLEMLKDICISLGLVFRVAVNSAGERYLDVRAADLGNTSVGWDADNRWFSDVKVHPYSRRITGLEVVSGQENITRGVIGNESMKMACVFTTANYIRIDEDFRKYARGIGGGDVAVVVGEAPGHAFWSSLWTLAGTPTGLNYPGAYSICAIAPAMTGNVASEQRGGTFAYIQHETEGSASFDLGEFKTGTSWGINWEAGGTDGTVLYPNDAQPVNSWGEVPAMALSHYLFSPRRADHDVVGIYRSKGFEVEIVRGEIIGTAAPTPGSLVTVNIGTGTYDCRVTRVTEDFVDNVTKFTLEYWGL